MKPYPTSERSAIYHLPSPWTANSVDGQSFPGFGYGTYRTTLLFSDEHPQYIHFSTRRIKLAHAMYLNGELLYSVGKPGASAQDTIHQQVPKISDAVSIPSNKRLDVALVVANYAYYRGGVDSSIEVGTRSAFEDRRTLQLTTSAFVAGSLMIMAFYHFGLWFKRRRDLSALAFGLFCFAIGIRMLVTGEKVLTTILPQISPETMLLIELGTVYLGMPILHYFVHFLFPRQSANILLYIASGALVLFASPIILGNLYLSSSMIFLFEIYVVAMLVSILAIGILALARNEQGSTLFLFGLYILFVAAIHDILIERGIISGLYSLHYGFLVFIFVQSALLSTRFANAYNGIEEVNTNLEQLVDERTTDLQIAHRKALEIGEQNRRLSTRMTTLLETERRDIAKEIHDNFNSRLVAARMHVNVIIKSVDQVPPSLSGIRLSALKIRDILKESYTNARALVSRLRPEIIDTLGLPTALKQMLNSYDSENIRINFEVFRDEDVQLPSDANIALYRIAQEAVTNALKHAKASTIEVSFKAGTDCTLSIKDDGIGFDPQANVGNGISHMRERTLSLNGNFSIQSSDAGTKIVVTIPNISDNTANPNSP